MGFGRHKYLANLNHSCNHNIDFRYFQVKNIGSDLGSAFKGFKKAVNEEPTKKEIKITNNVLNWFF